MNPVLLYVAAGLTALWGTSHLCATKGVVKGFGALTPDNRRIITMEWLVEGVAFLSIAAFVLAATLSAAGSSSAVSSAVFAVAVGTLAVMAIVAFFTGFRIAFIPFKLCPFICLTSAVLIALGAWF